MPRCIHAADRRAMSSPSRCLSSAKLVELEAQLARLEGASHALSNSLRDMHPRLDAARLDDIVRDFVTAAGLSPQS